MTCPECKGTGKVILFTSVERCEACKGSGAEGGIKMSGVKWGTINPESISNVGGFFEGAEVDELSEWTPAGSLVGWWDSKNGWVDLKGGSSLVGIKQSDGSTIIARKTNDSPKK